MGQGFTLYTALNSGGWTNSSFNHGNFAGLKASTSRPIMCRTLDAAAAGMRKAKYRMADTAKKVSFSCQARSRAAPISKSSMRLPMPSMESSSRSAADRKLPRRTASIKTRAASQSVGQSTTALSRSSWGTPLAGARCIQDPFRWVNLAEYRAFHNHDGFGGPGILTFLQTVEVDAPGIPRGAVAARAVFESKPRDFSCKPSYPEVRDRCMKSQTGSLDLPRKFGNGTNASGQFRSKIAFDSRNPRGVPGCPHRQQRPRDCAIGFGGNSRASDETQPDCRLGLEGSMRCDVAG